MAVTIHLPRRHPSLNLSLHCLPVESTTTNQDGGQLQLTAFHEGFGEEERGGIPLRLGKGDDRGCNDQSISPWRNSCIRGARRPYLIRFAFGIRVRSIIRRPPIEPVTLYRTIHTSIVKNRVLEKFIAAEAMDVAAPAPRGIEVTAETAHLQLMELTVTVEPMTCLLLFLHYEVTESHTWLGVPTLRSGYTEWLRLRPAAFLRSAATCRRAVRGLVARTLRERYGGVFSPAMWDAAVPRGIEASIREHARHWVVGGARGCYVCVVAIRVRVTFVYSEPPPRGCDGEPCAVCLGEMGETTGEHDEEAARLPGCGHAFHRGCVAR